MTRLDSPRLRRKSRDALFAIIASAALLRAALTPLYAYLPNGYLDEGFWKDWMSQIHQHGILNIFHSDTDYIGYHWVLWILSMTYAVIGGPYTQTSPSLHVLVKVPSILFDLGLIVCVYQATLSLFHEAEGGASQRSNARAERAALLSAAVLAFQPAVLYGSAVWAQTDAAVTLAMLGSVLLAARARTGAAWTVWTLGFLIKPHPIIVAPVLLVLTLRLRGVRGVAVSAIAVASCAAVVLGPWLLHGDAANIATTYKALFDANYDRLSASAWNLWWFRDLAAHPAPDDYINSAIPAVTYRMIGVLLSAIAGLIGVALVWKTPTLRMSLIAASYLTFAFYMLPVSTHERYLYPFLALMLPVVMLERRWLWLYVPASATLFLNMVVAAPPVESLSGRWVESPFSLAVAAVNVALFTGFTAAVLSLLKGHERDHASHSTALSGAIAVRAPRCVTPVETAKS